MGDEALPVRLLPPSALRLQRLTAFFMHSKIWHSVDISKQQEWKAWTGFIWHMRGMNLEALLTEY